MTVLPKSEWLTLPTEIKLTVSKYLCRPVFVRWRKTHRKKRIAKKWRKRYGPVTACPGYGYEINGFGLCVCPCAAAALQKLVRLR